MTSNINIDGLFYSIGTAPSAVAGQALVANGPDTASWGGVPGTVGPPSVYFYNTSVVVPTSIPSGAVGVLYVASGALVYKGSSGTITVIAPQ